MAIVKTRFMEDGKKIIVLEPVSHLVDTVFQNVEEIASKRPCDEFRMSLNGFEMKFGNGITKTELRNLYNKLQNKNKQLTKQEYEKMEFEVVPLLKDDWSYQEKIDLFRFNQDLALLTSEIEWAKEMDNDIKIQKRNLQM